MIIVGFRNRFATRLCAIVVLSRTFEHEPRTRLRILTFQPSAESPREAGHEPHAEAPRSCRVEVGRQSNTLVGHLEPEPLRPCRSKRVRNLRMRLMNLSESKGSRI